MSGNDRRSTRSAAVAERVEEQLWPFVQSVRETWAVPGLVVGVVHDGDQVMARGFGTRTGRTGDPVTPDTLFHLASVSKTFVATAVLRLVEAGELALDGSITSYLPDLGWADPRAENVTLRHLLSHTSGLGDVSDYGWHEPELDDGALGRLAARVAGWTLEQDPGAGFSYSNAAYELLGHLVATVGGGAFEAHLAEHLLRPAGMATSTFLRADVPAGLGALPHHGLPPQVLDGVYPYTRRHAPSSTLHSSAAEMGRWMAVHLAGGRPLMSPATQAHMWEAQASTGWDWQQQMALGWFAGTHRGHRFVSHSGDDPGFESSLALVPDRGVGVVVLTNGNNAPMLTLTTAALDVLLGHDPPEVPLPPAAVRLGPVLARYGVDAAVELYGRLAAEDPPGVDPDDLGLEDATWGAVEMHRPDVVRSALELWHRLEPESSAAWAMTGWAHDVEGRTQQAVEHLRRAVALDPDNEDAATMLARLQSAPDPRIPSA